jgi:predicted dehydrogenase
MDLTPEQVAVGKENFNAAVGRLRRDFLEEGIRKDVASGNGLGALYYGYGASVSEPVRVGVIGTGDEGSVLIGALNPAFVQVTAIADIRPYSVYRAFHGDQYSSNAAKARPGLLAKYGWKSEDEARKHVKVYGDYRALLEEADDVEAVIIALPLHLHAAAAIAAMKAGKHVLTEKLMGHSVRECKEMARVAEETGLYLVTGHQRHYNVLYDNAVFLIQKGLLGDLHYIRAQWHRGNLPGTDSWQQPMPKEAKPDDFQAERLLEELTAWKKELEKSTVSTAEQWKRKIAQKEAQIADKVLKDTAADFGYEDKVIAGGTGFKDYHRPAVEELIRWRLWDRTGGGLMAELGSHQLDAASIFISAVHGGKKQMPLRVHAMASRPIFPVDRDCEDHVYCLFEFPAPDYDPKDEQARRKTITVAYASINGNGYGGYGETVFGTEGTLLLQREEEALLYRTHETTTKIKVSGSSDAKRPGPIMVPSDDGDPVMAAVATQGLGTDISRGYTEEIEHWTWCIRNPDAENKPHCHPKVAMADAVIALTSNLAAREGKSIEFNPAWFDPASDETPDGEKPDVSRYA